MTNSPYPQLAPIYDRVGMSRFAEILTPRLIEYAQQQDWLGRRVIDLGCGTGVSTRWLAGHGYAITAVDQSAEMLEQARKALPSEGLSLTWQQRDIRTLDGGLGQFDLALAFDVLNELASLRELEQTFAAVMQVLEAGKLFIFDMHTIQGLTEQGAEGEQLLFEDNQLVVMTQHAYDHDRQITHSHHRIFGREGELWRRSDARRTLRGYPIQAMATLLQRTGYEVLSMLITSLETYQVGESAARVIFIARKPE
jgi:2-polyprenyl-3-methyl-5-hydroxy-6-metoxy-1,4-benzoquinol methylase